MQLKVKDRFEIRGRGTVFTLSLAENNLPDSRKSLRQMIEDRQELEINGDKYTLIGVETFGTFDDKIQDNTGFLVRPL